MGQWYSSTVKTTKLQILWITLPLYVSNSLKNYFNCKGSFKVYKITVTFVPSVEQSLAMRAKFLAQKLRMAIDRVQAYS